MLFLVCHFLEKLPKTNPQKVTIEKEHTAIRCTILRRFQYFLPPREKVWSGRDHDKLPRSAVPPINGSKEIVGGAKGSNESQ